MSSYYAEIYKVTPENREEFKAGFNSTLEAWRYVQRYVESHWPHFVGIPESIIIDSKEWDRREIQLQDGFFASVSPI